ncbi:4-alpha-glucanotransferase [Achromobacter insuavis]|uniref:4-alpha-glucanotransferase n=1 Tax=Achromobacter insuavis TaxID=1287735 RepID=UPI001467634C|nr:4-alpha-glucanotransferase [Achromobacter insuavis]CAB3845195.1 4-alpha-glucanotransferase [Achromobacter insuavis]
MSATLSELAVAAGLAEHWTDARHQACTVAPDTLRALLRAMDLPADSEADIHDSRARLAAAHSEARLPAMLVAVAGTTLRLPAACAGRYEITGPQSAQLAGRAVAGASGLPELPVPAAPGYYTLALAAGTTTLAVAPPRAPTLAQLLGQPDARAWGLATQVYSLRRPAPDLVHATHGFGDFGALRDLAASAGAAGADALAISPVHAMFAADPAQYSPYSPSSRLFLNTLYADPAAVLGDDAVRAALAQLGSQAQQTLQTLEAQDLIDWPQAARARQRLLRQLHRDFDHAANSRQRQALQAFRDAGGQDLRDHALFEALHEHLARQPAAPGSWTEWPAGLRDPRSQAARAFAQAHGEALDFHVFAQWLAGASLAQAQQAARQAGMRVGLIADLAIGASPAGSHAWSHQAELMRRASVGAPPDIHNPLGQAWGLTALSPQALRETGYAAFIALLRASLAQAGGLRIDHILGLARLWLVPDGAPAGDGAYLRYPLRTLLRLAALEAWRHHALVIGENLGTVPEGFDEALHDHGLLGMDVLWFMREPPAARGAAAFKAPGAWPVQAAAMTTTHDLPTLEGWWQGRDIEWRNNLALLGPQERETDLRAQRDADRDSLWRAVRDHAHLPPDPAPAQTPVAALLAFVAAAPCPLALVPLEDATGTLDQPNLPGAGAGYPNWRQRQPLAAAGCLHDPAVRERLAPLRSLRGRKA